MEITHETWLREISQEASSAEDINTLLSRCGILWDLRRFEGVNPHGVNAFRYRARQLTPKECTVVVDADGLIYAADAVKSSSEEIPSCALSMLRRVYAETNPDNFIVAFDSDRRLKREQHPEYKHERVPSESVEEGKRLTIELLRSKGIQVEIVPGYEADDIAASVAFQSQVIGDTCIIVSEDKDLWQVLGPDTTLYNRKKRSHYGVQWLISNHRIKPIQAVDWLCMVGKNGIKGASGIAGKTASDLLEAHGDFIGVLDSELTESKRKSLEEVDYFTVKELHTLSRSLPIGRKRYERVLQHGSSQDAPPGHEDPGGGAWD